MTPADFPAEIDAKCCNCGCSWRFGRHDGFSCPWCAAYFTNVEFSQGKVIAFFEGERWDKKLTKRQHEAYVKYLDGLPPSPTY